MRKNTNRKSFIQHVLGHANALVGATIIVVFLIFALIGTIASPSDALTLDITQRLRPPSADHWFGTDQFGRDMFSRVMVGASASLVISLCSVVVAVTLGTLIGTAVGFVGGWFDNVAMAILDALMAFPSLLLALAVMAVFGPSRFGVVAALAMAYTPGVVRVVRGTVLSIREKEFVEASKALGNSTVYTVFRHVVPNAIGPLTVLATSLFATALLSESALSFLGLGVPPPAPTWGGMLSDAKQFIDSAAWLALFPGVSISLTLLGINLFGDALRDYFDPRMNAL